MLKPENFTPILAVIGIILYMLNKSDKMRNFGSMLIGFSVLMFGMETMSNAVKPLADVPEFTGILAKFQNPVLGVIAGAVLTGIIQSSAASVGILQALSMTGQITFGAAIPIIMGQNIGTCVTALISCIGANKNAKRAAMVHLYFNIIGTILFLVLFYAANAVLHFAFVDNAVTAFNIAVVHTIFNIMATLVLMPFRNVLVKLAEHTVKGMKVQYTDESILDERFLQTPAYAVEQCNTLTINMGYIAQETFEAAVDTMRHYSKEMDKLVCDNEKKADHYEDSIGAYLVKLSAKDLSSKDSQRVSQLLHTIGDFEQITDYAKSILYVAREINEKGIKFSEKALAELDIITSAISQIIDLTVTAFDNDDPKIALKVEPLEEVVDVLKSKLKSRHIRRLQDGKCTIEQGFIFSDYISNLEKISDHCLNISLYQTQTDDDSYELHQYMKERRKSDITYKEQYNHYSRKYALPFSASETK